MRVPDWTLPLFAPLSRSVIDHIYANRLLDHRALTEEEVLSRLLIDCKVARVSAFVQFHPFVVLGKHREGGGYGIEWFLELIARHSAGSKPIPRSTLANWYQRNLVRYQAYGTLDPESGVAVFMARLLDRERKRDWLPPSIPKGEPRWYCWHVQRPESELVVTGVPIEARLPRRGILLSVWRGWDTTWKHYERGAIRWRLSSSTPARGQYWEITPDELLSWDSEMATYLCELPPSVVDAELREAMVEDGANMVLNRLAARFFREVIPALEKGGMMYERSRISPQFR